MTHTRPPAKQMNTDTPWTNTKEFIGQAEWAEDNAPLLGCVEATYARRLERLVKEQHDALATCGDCSSVSKRPIYVYDPELVDAALTSFNQLRKEMEA